MSCCYIPHVTCPCLLTWIIVTFSVWHSSCTVHISYDGPRNTASSLIKVKHKYGPVNLTPFSILLRGRSTSQTLPQSSFILPLPLSNLADFSVSPQPLWGLDERPRREARDVIAWLRSLDNEVLRPEMEEKRPKQINPLIPRAGTFSTSNPVLSVAKLMIKNKKIEEINKALRRKHKNELAAAGEKSKFGDPDTSVLAQSTAREVEDIEELNKRIKSQHKKLAKSQPIMFAVQPSYSHGVGSISPEADSDFSDFYDTDIAKMPGGIIRFLNHNSAMNFDDLDKLPMSKQSQLELPYLDRFTNSGDEKYLPTSQTFPASPYSLGTNIRPQPMEAFNSDDLSNLPTFVDRPTFTEKFMDIPFNDFQYLPQQDGFHAASDAASEPLHGEKTDIDSDYQRDSTAAGFWESGHFVDENKDCDVISTKTCFSDVDCSCHGFYVCMQGRCDLVMNLKQTADDGMWQDDPSDFGFAEQEADVKKPVDDHVWHDEPIDFGFAEQRTELKQPADDHVWYNGPIDFGRTKEEADVKQPADDQL